jgi:NTE family protein
MRRGTLVLTLLMVFAAVGGADQDDRPKIGLVLSGGGALGAAHIGVLKVLDELRVPIYCVTGTSMGGVVGGLHAAGYAPDELEDIILDIDWRTLLDDRPPRRRVPFRQKVDDLTFLTRLEMGFNRGKFQLPAALIQGQKLDFLLQALTVHTVGIGSFDDLPIPFRTVATDLETGAAVVLKSGDLARAIRASMAVPGVFAPSVIDNRVLVDGGLVDNLPVDLAREMGADVVIAVDVGEPLRTRQDLDSLTRVAGQVVSMMIRRNVDRQIAAADLVLFPDMEGFGAADFHRADRMIPLGEAVARASAEDLGVYSVSESEYAELRSRLMRRDVVEPTIVSVQVAASSRADPDFLFARVRTRPGDPLDANAIARDLERLYAEGDYERVTFYLTKVEGGYVLHIEADEKSWGPHVMRFGLNLTADFEGESDFNARANYTLTRLNRLRAETKVAIQVGGENLLAAEFYQPLHSSGRIFVAPTLTVTKAGTSTTPVGGVFGGLTVSTLDSGLDLGLSLREWGELRVGVTRGNGRARPKQSSVLPDSDFDTGGLRARLILDQLDNPNFPRNGWIANAELLSAREYLGSDADYESLRSGVFGAASWGRHTLLGSLEYDGALGTDLPVFEQFSLGGLFRLSGYPTGSFVGPYLGLAIASYYYQLGDFGTSIVSGIYAGASLEAGNVWQHRDDAGLDDLLWAGSLYVGLDTFFGPVYVAHGRGEAGQNTWYVFLGRSF